MELYLKLVAPIIVLLGNLVNYFLDDKKKQDKYKKRVIAQRILVGLIVLGSIAAGIVIIFDHKNSIIDQNNIDDLNIKLDKAAINNDTLLTNMKELQSSLTVFLREAEFRYPNLNSREALTALANDLGKLQMEVDTLQVNYLANKESQRNQDQLKQTPPQIEARLIINENNRYLVEIKSQNDVPFEARWSLTNQNNGVLSTVMMGNEKIYPTENRNSWLYNASIDSTELIDNYVKLSFRYWSIFFAEMGSPDSLRGKIIHEYRLVENIPIPLN